MGLLDAARNQMDATWLKARQIAGYCSSDTSLQNARLYLGKTDDYLKYAYNVSAFTGRNPAVSAQLEKASNAIGPIRKHVDAADRACGDVVAIGAMGDAIAVLNGWVAHPPTRTADEAAAAFDMLFGACGRFAARLPAPINAYAQVLETIGIARFFSGMRALVDPERRQGGQLRRILEEDDALFRPRN